MRFPRARVNFWLVEGQYAVAGWLQERRRTRRLGEYLETAQRMLVETPTRRTLCAFLGHLPERDQCMRPEHDYCVWCLRSMPYAWSPP